MLNTRDYERCLKFRTGSKVRHVTERVDTWFTQPLLGNVERVATRPGVDANKPYGVFEVRWENGDNADKLERMDGNVLRFDR